VILASGHRRSRAQGRRMGHPAGTSALLWKSAPWCVGRWFRPPLRRSQKRRKAACAAGLCLLAKFANLDNIVSRFEFSERVAVMPTRNVNLTDELDRFVARKIKAGRYENASEVVRAGLRNLEREEREYEAKLAGLRAAVDEGDASGVARGDVFRRVRKRLKLPAASR